MSHALLEYYYSWWRLWTLAFEKSYSNDREQFDFFFKFFFETTPTRVSSVCKCLPNLCVRARAFVSFGVGEGALSEGKINTRVRVSATDRFSPLHEGTELRTRIVCGPGLKHDAVVANSSLLYRRPFPSLIVNSRTCYKGDFSRTTEWSCRLSFYL